MGRFLSPKDRLYYKSVWTSLQLEFGLEISNERVNGVNALIKRGEFPKASFSSSP